MTGRQEMRPDAPDLAAATWRSFAGRPLSEWPDAVLVAFLMLEGAWQPIEGSAGPSDAELDVIIADAVDEAATFLHAVPERRELASAGLNLAGELP